MGTLVRPWVDAGDLDLLLDDSWQMTMAERAAVILYAAQLQPRIALEVGTADGGSTAALARFAGHVYTIDVDPASAEKVAHLGNVTALTGDSADVLPALLADLSDDDGHPVELALVDGDHTTEGVARDLDALTDPRPARSMFMLMHDTGNPVCRAGVIAAAWSRWTWHVEADLVGPSIVDGKLWGGLGFAQLVPVARTDPLQVVESGRVTFDTLRAGLTR